MDKDRRTFLKIILIGSGTLLVGKILDPLFSRFFKDSLTKADLSPKINSEFFQIVDDKEILSIYDNSGEEIFQIDKRT